MYQHSPLKLLLIGSLAFVGGSSFSLYLWLTPPQTLTQTDLVEVSGPITRIAVREGRSPQLRIWIDDREEPYCATGPYPA
jgi:peptidoglycan/LPS O-acetylase OafA/YrhL